MTNRKSNSQTANNRPDTEVLGTIICQGEVISSPIGVNAHTKDGSARMVQTIAFTTPTGQLRHASVFANVPAQEHHLRDRGYVGEYLVTKESFKGGPPRYMAIPALNNLASDDDGF